MCDVCKGRLHVPGEHGWTRCACLHAATAKARIHVALRGTDLVYPPAVAQLSPWPWSDVLITHNGLSVPEFKHMVWRSLDHYLDEATALTYDVMDAMRILEIQLSRADTTYPSLQQVIELDLLVLFYGPPGSENRYAPVLVQRLVSQRRELLHPTWVWCARGCRFDTTQMGGSSPAMEIPVVIAETTTTATATGYILPKPQKGPAA